MKSIITDIRNTIDHIETKDFKLFVFDSRQIFWAKLFLFLIVIIPLYLFATTIFLLWINSKHSDNLYQIGLLLQQNGTLPLPSPSPLPP